MNDDKAVDQYIKARKELDQLSPDDPGHAELESKVSEMRSALPHPFRLMLR